MKTNFAGVLAAMLAAIVLSMPLAFAQEAQVQTATTTETSTKISPLGLRFRQLGEAFGDFVFTVKSVLTFDESAKMGLLKERNADMRARQTAWIETKAQALAQFRSGNLTEQEKEDIIEMLHSEHKAIIKEHLRLTAEMREFQLRAKAKGNTELENRAEAAAEEAENSGLSDGLNASGSSLVALGTGTKVVTSDEAKTSVEKAFNIKGTTVTTETRNGKTFYVVTGTEASTEGGYRLQQNIEISVEADTGILVSADLGAHIEATNTTA